MQHLRKTVRRASIIRQGRRREPSAELIDRERQVSEASAPSADSVIEQAIRETGWSGGVDGALREGLEQNLAAFAAAPIFPEVREGAYATLVSDLVKRFRIEQYLAENPEIEQQEIEGPLIVGSIARSGTTATVAMLALDPRFRFARDWELREPLPPPVAGEEDNDPRVLAARQRAANIDQSVHLYDPDGPEEELVVLAGYDMRQSHQRYPMPDSYIDWWMNDDFGSMYAFHEKVLKLLQWKRGPNRWLLKSPPHLFRFEAIARQYPDATIVMTHREPTSTVASAASLFELMYSNICPPGAISKERIGERCLDFWSRGMNIALRDRDKLGEDRFADVWNRDLIKDPIATFEKLYDRLGYTIDDAMRARLVDYQTRNAKGAHGAHKYTLEEYGLSEEQVNATFAEYNERFGFG
jgi:hypothetical protein